MRRRPPSTKTSSWSLAALSILVLGTQVQAQPIQWELVGSKPSKQENETVIWRDLPPPPQLPPINQNLTVWTEVGDSKEPEFPSSQIAWEVLTEIESNLSDEEIAHQPSEGQIQPVLIPPPPLQALDRSVAFQDGFVGPDISVNIPNGLRWSERWFGSASLRGQSRRPIDSSFYQWNDGDAVAIIHANILQTKDWSIGINTSFRSVYQGDQQVAGGSTSVGEGISSGFRVAKSLNATAGIAFGGEQVLQWDDKTDTGRNLYLMVTKGWWLGKQGNDYPLLIANGGVGTGRFANDNILTPWINPIRFACIEGFEDRIKTYSVDNDLCWSPIGSLSIVYNDYLSTFVEYRSGTATVAGSISLSERIPLRFSWGVDFAFRNEILPADEMRWLFRASLGF